ncbi:hypothetical protein [Sediminitomix flava]|uniref:Uncharacterized protein n=1 Tax=Sediminitomix flava TaxID=379075 RepID=A0A315Z9R8_SEDFL|nr:hypothetical protein [Sediminitomix flava]PWJ41803.1 hypothetical protein BC781_10353 [Sediminitomix flava]
MKLNIKKYSQFLLATALPFFAGCGEEMNIPEVITPSHSVIKVSQSGNDNLINIDQVIDFADVSQGVKSRTWTFPTEEGTVTVEGDPTTAQVRGIFHKVGTWEVGLHQEFKNQPYVGDGTTPIDGTSYDTTINVTVMPALEISSMKANLLSSDGQVGEELPLNPSTPTEIPFGSVVRFTYQAIGSPSVVDGNFDGAQLLGNDAENSTFDVKYVTLDKVYSASPVLIRPMPQSSDTLYIENFVKCVRSEEPVTLDEVIYDMANEANVHLIFSRGLNPASVASENFAVKITTADGVVLTPALEASVNPSDESIIVLKLDGEQIYSDDQVTVSYFGGEVETADKAIVAEFEDTALKIVEENLLETAGYDYSFESSSVNWNAGQPSWLGGDFTNTLVKTTERATVGMYSLKISVNPYNGVGAWGNGTIIQPFENGVAHNFPYVAEGSNKIKIAFDGYLEENGGGIDPTIPNQFNTNMRMYLNWGAGGAEKPHTIGGTEEGVWKEYVDVVTVSNIQPSYGMAVKIAQTGLENVTIYIDNIRVTRWNPRP